MDYLQQQDYPSRLLTASHVAPSAEPHLRESATSPELVPLPLRDRHTPCCGFLTNGPGNGQPPNMLQARSLRPLTKYIALLLPPKPCLHTPAQVPPTLYRPPPTVCSAVVPPPLLLGCTAAGAAGSRPAPQAPLRAARPESRLRAQDAGNCGWVRGWVRMSGSMPMNPGCNAQKPRCVNLP